MHGGGYGASLESRVGGQSAAPKKKPRHRKHGKGAQAAVMVSCESLDSDMQRRFVACFAPLMRSFRAVDLTDDDGDDEPEAGPSGHAHDDNDFEIPEEDEGPEIPEGDEPEDDGFSNTG